MPQSLAKVYLHIVFSTKNRNSWIVDEICHRLYSYMGTICKDRGFPLYQIGGMEDHLHLLVEHHKKRGFQQEYLLLLQRAGIEYDERYLWD
jgi:REP element-mobilizing transposase RayT